MANAVKLATITAQLPFKAAGVDPYAEYSEPIGLTQTVTYTVVSGEEGVNELGLTQIAYGYVEIFADAGNALSLEDMAVEQLVGSMAFNQEVTYTVSYVNGHGVIQDVIENARTFSPTDKIGLSLGRLKRLYGDFEEMSSEFRQRNEVQTIAGDTEGHSGTFLLIFSIKGHDGAIVTSAIANDAETEAVQTAVDNAMVAAGVENYFPGDIIISGGKWSDGQDLIITFAGSSVGFRDQGLTVFTWTDAHPTVPLVTTTISGQSNRKIWYLLHMWDVVRDNPPPSQAAPVDATPGSNGLSINTSLIRELAQEAAYHDDNRKSYDSIVSIFKSRDFSPLI